MLTAMRLREILRYDPETGLFTRLTDRGGRRAGEVAGSQRKDDRRIQIYVDNRNEMAHRLAWLYMTGEWPSEEVDHRDMNPSNNRWSNLRLASHSQNAMNRTKRSDNTTGLKGVYRHYKNGKFRAAIAANKKQYHLGVFDTREEAHAAYEAAAAKLHGEFARVA